MQTQEHALEIVDRLLSEARSSNFSCVAITAKTVADILQRATSAKNNAMPTACKALSERFRVGRDYFRRGKNRKEWFTSINGSETSTFEILFDFNR